MDPESLREEVDAWVRDDVISEAQAEEILARYDREESSRPRAVLALSVVGSALVFAGVVLFLATNWADLPRAARTLVLLAGPTLAYAAGVGAYEFDVPRIGHALCVLGAVLVGPSLFLFSELYALGIALEWLLFAWGIVALPTGHLLTSRPATGVGLGLLAGVVVALSEQADPAPAVGLLGVLLFALGRSQAGRVGWTYRSVGVALTLAALLALTLVQGQFGLFDVGPTPVLVAAAVAAVAGGGWLASVDDRPAVEWTLIALAALALATTVATVAPDPVPELLAFVSLHVAALAGLVGAGYLGYRERSRTLVDLATVGGLLQTLSFVEATVVDALSGAVALVVAGLVLLAAGVALERGRRSLLARL